MEDFQEAIKCYDRVETVNGYQIGIVYYKGEIDYIAILSETAAPETWTDGGDCPFILWHCNPFEENPADVLAEVRQRCMDSNFSYTGPRYGN